ncbi:MAG: hypothetical protein ACR2GL_08295 [Thermoleophilaceae bacterium]
MGPEGWIFTFGFRVIYVVLLAVWLIWFFRLRDDGEDPPEEGGEGGGEGRGPTPLGGPGGGLPLPIGRVPQKQRRRRDGHRPARAGRSRRDPNLPTLPSPLPARVRLPSGAPARTTRR